MNNDRPMLPNATPMIMGVILFFVCVFLFILFPRLDLSISSYFYDTAHNEFIGEGHAGVLFIYEFTHAIGVFFIIGLPFLLTTTFIVKNERLKKWRRKLIFLFSVCLLGPGLIINVGLKDNWERPRPVDTTYFGGKKTYEPPFSPKFECNNCRSFVSGHALVGFFFFTFALLARNLKWLAASILLGSLIGLGRIAQGGHFFSDVLFSGWVMWFVSLGLYHLFIVRPARKCH